MSITLIGSGGFHDCCNNLKIFPVASESSKEIVSSDICLLLYLTKRRYNKPNEVISKL